MYAPGERCVTIFKNQLTAQQRLLHYDLKKILLQNKNFKSSIPLRIDDLIAEK